ncbi:MAG: hypothetical protein Q8Q60_00935 [Candidatus Chromulinivorax sp.]|nr:hypothetical protein [Candidatus Chromulinivorax sp.]
MKYNKFFVSFLCFFSTLQSNPSKIIKIGVSGASLYYLVRIIDKAHGDTRKAKPFIQKDLEDLKRIITNYRN